MNELRGSHTLPEPRTLRSSEKRPPRFFYGYAVIIAAFFIMAIMWGTIFSFGVFLKPVSVEFGWTRAMTTGAYSLYMVLHGFLHIVMGRINDRFGPRIVVSVCGFFLGVGFLLLSNISSIWQLYLFYGILISIGMGGAYVPVLSTVARWFVRRRGLFSGIVSSGMGAGIMIMPPIARLLISTYGWRFSYIIVGIVVLVLVILAAQFLKRDPSQMGQLPDGDNEIKQESWASGNGGFSLPEAFRSRQFWMVCAMFFCFGTLVHTIMVHIVPHATDLGTSTIVAVSILTAIGGVGIIGRIGLGSTADRIGKKRTLVSVFVLMLVAFIWLLPAKETWMLFLFAVVFGFAFGGGDALLSPLVAELFGLKSHGVILGIIAFLSTVGGAIGPLLAGYIFDMTSSYQISFSLSAGLSAIGLILVFLLKPTCRQ